MKYQKQKNKLDNNNHTNPLEKKRKKKNLCYDILEEKNIMFSVVSCALSIKHI